MGKLGHPPALSFLGGRKALSSLMSSKPQPGLSTSLFAAHESSNNKLELEAQSASQGSLESRELGEAVARRTRTLIALGPILEIERNKAQRDVDLSLHDLRMLCLVILDVVIDKMGFATGAGRRDVLNALSPIVRSAEPTISNEKEEQIADLVLGALLNERERRQQFVERYAALEEGVVLWREFAFRLLEEMLLPDSEDRVFRASSEAINLYTEMLGYNLEDASQADLAVLKYQSDRGRLDDAIQTARQAQIRAKAYAERIRTALEISRRDADQAKWTSEMLPLIADALDHIKDRLHREGELRAGLEQRRDQATSHDLEKLNRLLNEIEKSERTNLELHNLLLTANDKFREEHSRQRLRRADAGLHVDLQPEVLLPWIAGDLGFAAHLAIPVLNLLVGHTISALPSLDQLWSKLLAAPIAATAPQADVSMPNTAPLQEAPAIFDSEHRLAVRGLLRAELVEKRLLSELILIARNRGVESEAQRLLILLTMEQFGAAGERLQFQVNPTGAHFAIDAFAGDDLELSRLSR